MDVVTANSSLVVVEVHLRSRSLSWALHGGGRSTFRVIASVIVRAHPDLPVVSLWPYSVWIYPLPRQATRPPGPPFMSRPTALPRARKTCFVARSAMSRDPLSSIEGVRVPGHIDRDCDDFAIVASASVTPECNVDFPLLNVGFSPLDPSYGVSFDAFLHGGSIRVR